MFLCIDTSTRFTCVGLFSDTGVSIAKSTSEVSDSHNEELAVEVLKLLAQGDCAEELSALVVGLGPGSFTGLRIGLSFAKGFAFARNLALAGISTFEAVAMKLSSDRLSTVLVHSDARRQESFACVAERGALTLPVQIVGISELARLEEMASKAGGEIVNLDSPYDLSESVSWAYLNRKELVTVAVPPDYLAIKPCYVRAVSAQTIEQRANKGG